MNAPQIASLRLVSAFSAAALLVGCGTGERTGTDGGIIGDTVVETLKIEGTPLEMPMPVTCPAAGFSPDVFELKAYCENVKTGKRRDVTGVVFWRPGDQAFLVANNADKKGTFTPKCPLPHAGKQVVSAEGACGRAAVEVLLTYKAPDVFADNVPKNIADAFNGPLSPNIDDQPQIIYPLDAAMHAPNVGQITVQWKDPGQHAYFKMHLTGDAIDATMYVGSMGICSSDNTDPKGMRLNCGWQPPALAWRTVSESAKGAQVTLTITGTAGAGALVAESPPITLNFSPEFVRGGFYYFSPSIYGLKRLPFGSPKAADYIKGGANTANQCIGCHTVSPDGKRVAATFFGADGLGGIVDANNSNKFLSPPLSSPIKRWNFATFSPDGRYLLTNWAGQLELRDGVTGARKRTIGMDITGGRAIQPDWSPDGDSVAFVQVPADGKIGKDFMNGNLQAGDFVASNTGNIAVMRVTNNENFEPARVIVQSQPGLEYHYFPSWAPESNFIVFVTATAPGSSATAWGNVYGSKPVPQPYQNYVMTYDQDTARLRLVAAEGGTPIELTSATHQQGTTTSWPRFAPFKQGNLAFFTFSAKFPYGYLAADGKTPQLWMSAVDLARAASDQGATDPSYPPFWLPFQEPKEKNHSGIWTTRIPCNNNDDCGEGFVCSMEKFCEPIING